MTAAMTNVTTPLAEASVAAPTRVEGQVHPLSVDLAGALRVVGSIAVSGGATAANQTLEIAQLTALNTAIGTIGDAAWSGTGNGTVISILKAIAINTTPPI